MSPLFIAAPAWVAGSGSNHAKSQGGDHSQQRGDRLSARPNSSKPGGAQPGSTRTTDGSEPSPRPAVTHGKYKSNPISLSAPARPAASCPAKPPAHPNRLPQPVLQIKPNSPSAPGSPPRSTERTHQRTPIGWCNPNCKSNPIQRPPTVATTKTCMGAAAWPLEKTNPLRRPAKENKGIASRRQSISEEPPQAHRRPFPQTAMPTFISGAIAQSDRGARSFAD